MWSNEKTLGSSAPPRAPDTCSAASSRRPWRTIVFAPLVGRIRTATVTADLAGSSAVGAVAVEAACVAASLFTVDSGGFRPGESGRRVNRVGVRVGVKGAAAVAALARIVGDRRIVGDAADADRAARDAGDDAVDVARAVAGLPVAAAGAGEPLLRLDDGRSIGIGLACRR